MELEIIENSWRTKRKMDALQRRLSIISHFSSFGSRIKCHLVPSKNIILIAIISEGIVVNTIEKKPAEVMTKRWKKNERKTLAH